MAAKNEISAIDSVGGYKASNIEAVSCSATCLHGHLEI
jgi:hypothetical protein